MGEERADSPSIIQERTNAMAHRLADKAAAADQRWGAHTAGLSHDQQRDLRKLLTRVQEMIRETSLDDEAPKLSRKEEAAHGLEVITNRINKRTDSFIARERKREAAPSSGLAL